MPPWVGRECAQDGTLVTREREPETIIGSAISEVILHAPITSKHHEG
jgi:hypothetical protein